MSKDTAAFFENPTRASLNYLVLMLLKSSPKHGYMLMQDIERHTEGGWKPSHSAIYKLLNNLEEAGYITSWEEKDGERGRRVYKITENGEKLIDESEKEFEFYMNAFISSLLEAKEDIKQDHITTLLTEKGKEITKCFEPHRRYRVLARLKAFVDSEAIRIDNELKDLKEYAN
ncbi:MAG TPA: PadR family transcriptional regulator [Methanocella sp.]|uniref:PadR family transcriptional regulator n=1 Tax=Methanocella sp. TaxID=2052833 RepID=UPI002B91591E|nr:PadR family transcriptional regulator [Methanocella sp.]HTY91338.1 PadR family transcriptional regulator [Methanocella sp.]